MHSIFLLFLMSSSAVMISLGFASHCSFLILMFLVSVFLSKNNSLINLMLLLEMMVLNMMFFILLESNSLMINYWNIFTILVLSAVEASVGLSLVVSVSRVWGSVMKINLFT